MRVVLSWIIQRPFAWSIAWNESRKTSFVHWTTKSCRISNQKREKSLVQKFPRKSHWPVGWNSKTHSGKLWRWCSKGSISSSKRRWGYQRQWKGQDACCLATFVWQKRLKKYFLTNFRWIFAKKWKEVCGFDGRRQQKQK